MQPYQEASEEIRKQGERPSNALKTAASLGASYAGATLLSRVMPLLSRYVPQNLAIKGLSKIDPRFEKFINKALANGTSFEDVKSFITDKAKEEEKRQPSKEQRNIIQQYSPELHEFIDQEVKKGRKLIEAGALAQNNKRFNNIISKITKDHKTPWSNILESVYGGEGQAQVQQSQQQAQSQPGISDQDLLAAIEKTLKL